MDVKVTPSDTEPGASVELNLEAKPNSYIGLLGVDQSVTLLKTGNDIEYVSQLYYYHLQLNTIVCSSPKSS